jgi:hypothetical protein
MGLKFIEADNQRLEANKYCKFIALGRLVKKKNYKTLIETFVDARTLDPNII